MILMAIFHFSYDLSLYGYVAFDNDAPFWAGFRFVIVTLFFMTVGISLVLANRNGIRWGAFTRRALKIAGGAAVLSVATWFAYPNAWIWFGVLHFILVASILALPLVFRPTLALILGIGLFVLYNATDWFNLSFLYDLLKSPLNLPNRTLDLTRLIPWLGMVYIGIFVGHHRLFGLQRLPNLGINPLLSWLGRHSLGFYLIHQIPLYGLAWAIHWLIG